MGLAPGGRMRQQIYEDPYALSDWDARTRAAASSTSRTPWSGAAITGENAAHRAPHRGATTRRHGLPWFEYYDEDAVALAGSTLSQA